MRKRLLDRLHLCLHSTYFRIALPVAIFFCVPFLPCVVAMAKQAESSNGACVSGRASCYQSGYYALAPDEERQGRDTWYFWTGGETNDAGEVVGDQTLWRKLAIQSHGTFDLLQSLDSRYHDERFKRFGVINDPDCRKTSKPDRYGLYLDECDSPDIPETPQMGAPTGVIGLRRFNNPKFDEKAWNLEKYLRDPASVEPPYLIGVACAFCHASFNPQHPPANPEKPEWRNIHPGIGNQYLREQIFNTAKYPESRGLKPNDFRWQVANAQPPGTSETSQVATDHINNPGSINNIANSNLRPTHSETTADGVTREVFNVIKDGADSVGAACLSDPKEQAGKNDMACAAMRGYINIGVCGDYWITLHDPVYGLKQKQKPFHPAEARKASRPCRDAWNATEKRLPGLEAFLRSLKSLPLVDADNAAAYIPTDKVQLARGKMVFAEQCARCHSSRAFSEREPNPTVDWYRSITDSKDFVSGDFLSDDERHPVSEIGTNSERAMASNAMAGHIWEDFSSEDYKHLPPVTVSQLVNPLDTRTNLPAFEATGGRGYYRTPTLANVWATAPFLHNNSVGIFNNDPSVAGRMAAYEDGMEKMLWPEKRLGLAGIQRTTQASAFYFDEGGYACIARNTSIDLIANVDGAMPALFRRDNLLTRALCHFMGSGRLNSLFLRHNNAPDFVEDRGHTYGASLTDADKRALIEYMKLL